MAMNGHPRRSAGRTLHRHAMSDIALVALFGAIAVWCTGGVAAAAVTNFTMTPDSGPPGTVVHVSGTGCTPGLLASIGTDFVTLTATTLNLATRAPVAANGSWQASFTVPASAAGVMPTPVDAVCVSSGIQSLLTIYTPQVFSVTAATTTTGGTNPAQGGTTNSAPPATNGGGAGGTTPTSPENPSHPKPTHPKPTTSPGSTVAAPGGGNGGGAGGAPPGDIGSVTIGTATSVAARNQAVHQGAPAASAGKQRTVAVAAATLQPADLGAALTPTTDGGGLGWLAWLLLIALALAVVGVPAWLWRSRRKQMTPSPGGEQP